jgi:hypothetical protein
MDGGGEDHRVDTAFQRMWMAPTASPDCTASCVGKLEEWFHGHFLSCVWCPVLVQRDILG